MNLIPNWRRAWRMLSVQIPAINASFIATWASIPAKFQDAYPLPWALGTVLVLLVLGSVLEIYSAIVVLAPLVVLTILFGVYPKPVLDMSAASVQQLVSNYQTAISAVKAAALVQ